MAEQIDETGLAQPLGKRRRRSSIKSKSKPQAQGALALVKSRRFGHLLFVAMVLLAAIYVRSSYDAVRLAGQRLGPVSLGMSPAEVRLTLDQPSPLEQPQHWLQFVRDGRTISVGLSSDGQQVSAITCHERDIASLACADQLGVRIGSDRNQVIRALGPAQIGISGMREVLSYPAIGTEFLIGHGAVVQIALANRQSRQGLWPVVLWRLLP